MTKKGNVEENLSANPIIRCSSRSIYGSCGAVLLLFMDLVFSNSDSNSSVPTRVAVVYVLPRTSFACKIAITREKRWIIRRTLKRDHNRRLDHSRVLHGRNRSFFTIKFIRREGRRVGNMCYNKRDYANCLRATTRKNVHR